MRSPIKSSPVTWSLALAAVAIAACAPAAAALEYNRQAIASGEWWRLFSCHFTHFGLEHLLWDAAVFGLLGSLCEERGRGRFLVTLIASVVVIPLGMWLLLPGMATYRGLSGLDSAFAGLLGTTALAEAWRRRAWPRAIALGAFVLLFASKVGYEYAAGKTIFVDSQAAGFTPVPLANAIGGAVGALVGLAWVFWGWRLHWNMGLTPSAQESTLYT